MRKKLFSDGARAAHQVTAAGHLVGLYVYGMLHRPLLTACLALAWLLLTLHFWPEEKR